MNKQVNYPPFAPCIYCEVKNPANKKNVNLGNNYERSITFTNLPICDACLKKEKSPKKVFTRLVIVAIGFFVGALIYGKLNLPSELSFLPHQSFLPTIICGIPILLIIIAIVQYNRDPHTDIEKGNVRKWLRNYTGINVE